MNPVECFNSLFEEADHQLSLFVPAECNITVDQTNAIIDLMTQYRDLTHKKRSSFYTAIICHHPEITDEGELVIAKTRVLLNQSGDDQLAIRVMVSNTGKRIVRFVAADLNGVVKDTRIMQLWKNNNPSDSLSTQEIKLLMGDLQKEVIQVVYRCEKRYSEDQRWDKSIIESNSNFSMILDVDADKKREALRLPRLHKQLDCYAANIRVLTYQPYQCEEY